MSTGIGGSSGPGSSGQGGGASGGAGPGPSSGSGGGVAGSLTAEYLASDTNANDSQMKPHFNLVNSGTDSVALTDVTIRYWFTKEAGAMQQEFWCDYALMNCTAINGDFGTANLLLPTKDSSTEEESLTVDLVSEEEWE